MTVAKNPSCKITISRTARAGIKVSVRGDTTGDADLDRRVRRALEILLGHQPVVAEAPK